MSIPPGGGLLVNKLIFDILKFRNHIQDIIYDTFNHLAKKRGGKEEGRAKSFQKLEEIMASVLLYHTRHTLHRIFFGRRIIPEQCYLGALR